MPLIIFSTTRLKALKILDKQHDLDSILGPFRTCGKPIAFVPTMGALHEGHLSLITEARKHADIVVCSIFVNPTQFNDPADFERYPRVVEEDAKMLGRAGCDVLFIPSVKAVYPDDSFKPDIRFGYLETVLEGAHRPGHFKGVGMVVKRLFDLVKPTVAFFGLKDYQQYMIIKELVRLYGLKIEIAGLPTIRENDGLAMSSRNRLLSPEERKTALALSKVLNNAKLSFKAGIPLQQIEISAQTELKNNPEIRLEYFAIADSESLKLLSDNQKIEKPIALVAAFVGKVRLIDNMFLFQ